MQFLFRDHLLDTDRRELSREQVPVAVEPQVFDLVVHLMENRDRVVSKGELIDKIWHGRSVSESTLTSRINAARKAIGDNGANQALIRTIARKGFRFVGDVEAKRGAAVQEPGPAAPLAQTTLALPDRPAIAVLPFTNMSGDREQDYFSDGISEDIITALSKLRWFFVVARNSSFVYKGRAVHVHEVARELGVRYVIEGSVRRSGERLRISAQLNDASTGSHLWAERYDRELADVFAVQDEITEAIVAAIEPQLYAAESFRAQQKPPGSLDAWDLVMRALSRYWRITREDNAAAQELLEKAIAIDPAYGKALGLLATSRIFGAHMGWAEMAATVPVAERAALAAVEADRDDAWAHHGLAYTYLFRRRFEDALAEFDLALKLNPNFAMAYAFYGVTLCYAGRWQDGDAAARRALRLSPRDPLAGIYGGVAAYARFIGRDYEGAVQMARESLRQRSDFVGAHRVLTAAAGMSGNAALAASALHGLRRAQPGISLAWITRELPMLRDEDRAHYLEGLRRAGMR
ncbi:winged helix-turn-helix domain-containing protein [Bradyrhizobium sp. 180]|uniref:winged helix-turn-helix domain-containing protein n=1 Tax=unclassified Bradyrhizobium TaxID=2631580 RepID=UPI001FFAC35C|nr:winged helix-turn-helix domain-containing protein [Bradyrhizobium sp. CW12]MCK1493842.1 winged helix-turn-helix domain-containing protein [Bradyrhizobium sp. 180]MCK1531948.1 winged helix-turn-helix domain-containing protein [Bradyrhizobium sp. 182]MCK1595174.1 winged helix-turn-helix domain-containing protein [Bradyrhizobium sp. 164]MCK1621134.1 winged helix-turn-helix domain-containing protein [Bradyrhizobium sp. 159]MCK1644603.1 winged helix-turn-helix domain-containing protein [Bradyrhi